MLLQLKLFNVEFVCMYITVSALQIFKLESHPSGFKAETGREGFSLYGTILAVKYLNSVGEKFSSFRCEHSTYSTTWHC